MGGRRKTRKTRKMKGGNGYGFTGAIGTNGPEWEANMTSTPDGKPYVPTGGGRRKTRKSKKTRKTRKMKGGAAWQTVGAVGYGYTGEGARGLADATAYASKVPVGGPAQGADGVSRV